MSKLHKRIFSFKEEYPNVVRINGKDTDLKTVRVTKTVGYVSGVPINTKDGILYRVKFPSSNPRAIKGVIAKAAEKAKLTPTYNLTNSSVTVMLPEGFIRELVPKRKTKAVQ
jgi:hypothetical protein